MLRATIEFEKFTTSILTLEYLHVILNGGYRKFYVSGESYKMPMQ